MLISFHHLKREEPILREERTQEAFRFFHFGLRQWSIMLWNPVGSNQCLLVGRDGCCGRVLRLRGRSPPMSHWAPHASFQPSFSFPSWIWCINQVSVVQNPLILMYKAHFKLRFHTFWSKMINLMMRLLQQKILQHLSFSKEPRWP